MNGFQKRSEPHDRWLLRVDDYERLLGLIVDKSEAEENMSLAERQALRQFPNDQTAKRLRWMPDRTIIGTIIAKQELKTRERDNTKNYAVEWNSYEVGKWLNDHGTRVFYIFCPADEMAQVANLKTIWIEDMEFFSNILIKHHGNGSGTPYKLIDETANFFCPLSLFLKREFLTRR